MKYLLYIVSITTAFLLIFIIKGNSQTFAEHNAFGDSLDFYIEKFDAALTPYEIHDADNPHEFDNTDPEGRMVAFPSYIRSRYPDADPGMKTKVKVRQVDSLVKEARKCLNKKDVYKFHDFVVANWKHFIFHPANNLDNEQELFSAILEISSRCYPKEQYHDESIQLYSWYMTHLKLTEVYKNGRINTMTEVNPRRPITTFCLMQHLYDSNQLSKAIALGEELLKDIRIAMPDDNDIVYESATELARYYRLADMDEKANTLKEKFHLRDFV